jgi:hypothetical protein
VHSQSDGARQGTGRYSDDIVAIRSRSCIRRQAWIFGRIALFRPPRGRQPGSTVHSGVDELSSALTDLRSETVVTGPNRRYAMIMLPTAAGIPSQNVLIRGRLRYAMRFVLAMWGTRGDVEPCSAIGRELLRRGHDVCMAVPPDVVGFVESAGLAAVAYGAEPRRWLDAHRNFFPNLLRNFFKILDLRRLWRDAAESGASGWADMSTTLVSLADRADLILTGMAYQEVAANVAEFYDIPLSLLHFAPVSTDCRSRTSRNPGLRRNVLSRAGGRMVEMEWQAALRGSAHPRIADG